MNCRGEYSFISLNYDLKTVIHDLPSKNTPLNCWPLFHAVIPSILIKITNQGTIIISLKEGLPSDILDEILNSNESGNEEFSIEWKHIPSFNNYDKHFSSIQQHLLDGDIYEMNYCHVFKGIASEGINSLHWFNHFNQRVKKPFSAFIKREGQSILCFSPERFLRKKGSLLITQPIKGTLPSHRKKANLKEYAENVMIVDLCRNDFAQICETGSVKVTELIGLYPFKNFNHLISTIRGRLKEKTPFTRILESCFPMGSMTGAPKYSAMRIIEEEENFGRSLYSGAIGYLNERGDFDFNVVIRTLFFDHKTRKVQVPVGGAILFDSTSISEYEETIQKVKFFSDDFNNLTNSFENQ